MPESHTHRRGLAILCALAACAGLAGCGAGASRSVAAVCHVWDTEGLALHEQFEAADRAVKTHEAAGLVGGIASIIGAPNELSHLMAQMAAVAPTESQSDFEAVAASFKKLSESESQALSNPIAALGGSLVASLAAGGSYERVDRFLAVQCGIPGR